jgi:DNA-binding SARP family transcriptional activator
LTSTSHPSNLSVEQILEQREQGTLVHVLLENPVTSSSSALLASAFDALDKESANCLVLLAQAVNAAKTVADAHVCCSIALAAALLDVGTQSSTGDWIERYVANRSVHPPETLSEFWGHIGEVAAYVHRANAVQVDCLSTSAQYLINVLNSTGDQVGSDTRLVAGLILIEYASASHETSLIDSVVSMVEHQSVMLTAKPVFRAHFYEFLGFVYFIRSNCSAAKTAWHRAETEALTHNLSAAGFMARVGLVRQLLDEADFKAADLHLANMRPKEGPGRAYQVTLYKHLLARKMLLQEQVSMARIEIDETLSLATRIGLVGSPIHIYLQEKAQVMFAQGEYQQAEDLLGSANAIEVGTSGVCVKANALLMRSARLLVSEPELAREALVEGLALASSVGFVRFLRGLPKVASILCASALKHNVQRDFVCQAIRERGLRAPSDAGSKWPWVLRIRLFGPVSVELEGEPLRFPGRTQAKPLELLCYLASSNQMYSDNLSLCSALWSADDLAKSLKNLEVTTGRLRKLLGRDDLVQVANGRTRLDAGQVWCDWAEFRSLAQQLSSAAATAAAASQSHTLLEQVAKNLLGAYVGPFMQGVEEVPWLIGRREDAKQRFVSAALSAKAAWPAKHEAGPLVAFWEAALFHEPLSEELALALMRHYASLKQPADAMRIYRFFREQASIRAGLIPSAKFEAAKSGLFAAVTK